MRWMEQAAYIAASRVGRGGRHLLTASMDDIAFRHPTRVGDILYVSAQVLPDCLLACCCRWLRAFDAFECASDI